MTPTLSLGRYVLISEVGRGAFGRLSTGCTRLDSGEAQSVLIRRLVKAAPLESDDFPPIKNAAELGKSAYGEHLSPVIAVEETDEELGVVFAYADGKDLRSVLSLAPLKHLRVPPGVAIHIVASALEGLAELRADFPEELRTAALWPDSVFIAADGTVRLLDAPIAAAIARVPGPRKFRQLIGYCAPEEFDQGSNLDQSDVFRAGILLWEMIASKRLFSGGTTTTNIEQVQKAPIPPFEELAPELAPLAEVVMFALERDCGSRYENTDEMLQALAGCGVPRASHEEVAAYLRELLGNGLAAQQRAVAIAIERLAPAEGGGAAAAESAAATQDIAATDTATAPPKFAALTGLSATGTLLGVPAPAVLPTRSRPPMPTPPPRPMRPPAGSSPLILPSIDDIESPLASEPEPGLEPEPERPSAESLTDIELLEEPNEPNAAAAVPLPLPLPLPLPAPPPPPSSATAPPATPPVAPAEEFAQELDSVAPEAPARPFGLKRAHLIAAAAALAILVLGGGVLALVGSSGGRDEPEPAASASGAAPSPAAAVPKAEPPAAASAAPAASADEPEAAVAKSPAEEPIEDAPPPAAATADAKSPPKTAALTAKQKREAAAAALKKQQAAAKKKKAAAIAAAKRAQAEKIAKINKAKKAKAAAAKKKQAAAKKKAQAKKPKPAAKTASAKP